jgi:hypothetical protein
MLTIIENIKSTVRICPPLCQLFGTKYVPNISFVFLHNLAVTHQYLVVAYCVTMIRVSLD